MLRKKLGVLAAIFCLAITMSACGQEKKEESSKGEELEKITFAEPARILSVAPFYVAIEQGFFKEEGIEAKIASGGGGAQVIASLLSGEAQFCSLRTTEYVCSSR